MPQDIPTQEPPPAPPTPAKPELSPAFKLQDKFNNLFGGSIEQLLDTGEALFVGVVLVAADGGRRHCIFYPELTEEMSKEKQEAAAAATSLGTFQAALEFGILHAQMSSSAQTALTRAARIN